jgi:hypothetical protein
MLAIMATKLICPVCISDSLQPILRDVHVSARIEGSSYDLSDLIAFSCADGHVFFVMSHNSDVLRHEEDTSLVM